VAIQSGNFYKTLFNNKILDCRASLAMTVF
jgi:hypothetical protein